jgi:hypothetical protein
MEKRIRLSRLNSNERAGIQLSNEELQEREELLRFINPKERV